MTEWDHWRIFLDIFIDSDEKQDLRPTSSNLVTIVYTAKQANAKYKMTFNLGLTITQAEKIKLKYQKQVFEQNIIYNVHKHINITKQMKS